MEGEPVPTAPVTLEAFLADRDAACPHCQYNLRGVRATVCPECGRDLELCLRESHPLALRRGLLALALLWLLAIGGVQGARCGRDVYQTAGRGQWAQILTTAGSTTFQTITIPSPVVSKNVTGSRSTSGTAPFTSSSTFSATINSGPSGGVATGPTTVRRSNGTTVFTSPNVRIVMPGNAALTSGLTWSNVGASQWVRLGLWSVVALLGMFGCLLLVVYRRRSPSRRGMRIMMAIVWLGFLVAAGIEVQTLVWEII